MLSLIGAYFGEGFGPSDPIKSKKLVAKPKEKKIPCGCWSRLFATESNLEQHAKLQQKFCWSPGLHVQSPDHSISFRSRKVLLDNGDLVFLEDEDEEDKVQEQVEEKYCRVRRKWADQKLPFRWSFLIQKQPLVSKSAKKIREIPDRWKKKSCCRRYVAKLGEENIWGGRWTIGLGKWAAWGEKHQSKSMPIWNALSKLKYRGPIHKTPSGTPISSAPYSMEKSLPKWSSSVTISINNSSNVHIHVNSSE